MARPLATGTFITVIKILALVLSVLHLASVDKSYSSLLDFVLNGIRLVYASAFIVDLSSSDMKLCFDLLFFFIHLRGIQHTLTAQL